MLTALLVRSASATSCLPLSIAERYANDDNVRTVVVETDTLLPDVRRYTARVVETWKGCSVPGDVITYDTSLDDDLWADLSVGSTYVVASSPSPAGPDRIGVCGLQASLGSLSVDERAYLASRYVACSDTCADGSAPATCDPLACDAASCDGAPCGVNPCTGCTLEFEVYEDDTVATWAGLVFDEDGDGICSAIDTCLEGDDAVDLDVDGIPDACDDDVATGTPGTTPPGTTGGTTGGTTTGSTTTAGTPPPPAPRPARRSSGCETAPGAGLAAVIAALLGIRRAR